MLGETSLLERILAPESVVETKRTRRNEKLAAAALVALLIGSSNATFASPISLGSGEIEFGQGSKAASACDDTINVEVNMAWSSADSYFKVSNLKLTGLNTQACLNKTITLRAFNGTTELDLNGTDVAGNASTTGNALTYTITSNTGTNVTQEIAVPGNINSANITKFSIETT